MQYYLPASEQGQREPATWRSSIRTVDQHAGRIAIAWVTAADHAPSNKKAVDHSNRTINGQPELRNNSAIQRVQFIPTRLLMAELSL